MPRYRNRQVPNRRTPNRGWAGQVASAATSIAANSRVLVASLVLDNQGIDETILRVVGGIGVASDQGAATEFQIGALGFAIVTDAALAIGITALPDPVTDVEDDMWFVYQSWAQQFRFVSGVGVEPDFMTWYPFDSKAKRVVHTGSSIVAIVSNSHSAEAFNVVLNFRMLTQVRGT